MLRIEWKNSFYRFATWNKNMEFEGTSCQITCKTSNSVQEKFNILKNVYMTADIEVK